MPRLERSVSAQHSPVLARLLRSWITVNEELAQYWKWKDCGWWNNESASVTTLAAAAWQLRGKAIEEYSESKLWRRSHFAGQVDLYVSIGGRQFVIEAKQCWPGAERRASSPKSRITKHLDEACKEVRRVPPRGAKRLGVVFAAPYLPKSQRGQADELLRTWISEIVSVPCSGVAWLFPAQMRRFVATDGYVYPGVALFVRSA